MDDHVRLERLLLDEALEADVTLEGPDAVVDQHVPLQVGRERELPRAHVTLVALHALHTDRKGFAFYTQFTAVQAVEKLCVCVRGTY